MAVLRLHDLVEYQARRAPRREFARHRGRSISYGEAAGESARLARALAGAGLGPGDRVAFVSRNSIEHVLLYFGASRAGVVPVPLNFRLPPQQWAFIIADARARVVVASAEYAQDIDAVRDRLPAVQTWVRIGEGTASGWIAYRDWIGAAVAGGAATALPDDAAVYQFYTSGTTGEPKGAVISHRALMAHLMQVTAFYGVPAERRILVVTPLSHAHAAIQAFVSACWGHCLCIMDQFEPAAFVDALAAERVNIAVVVPAMVRACLMQVPDLARRSFPDLQLMHYGAAPIAETTLRRAIEAFGCEFVQGYGMTETTAGVTFLLPEDHRRGLDERPDLLLSAGRAAMGNELRIVDDDGRELPSGSLGQVVVRGPTLMSGYWERAQATAEAIKDGWMHTGDIGRLDAEGYLTIVDRRQDVINSGGENVYPRAVEEVLLGHPAIADAAAVAVPDDRWGEAVKAFVVLREGRAAGADEILEFASRALAGFQRPRSIEFRDALPYTASGKLMRRALREPFWEGRARGVAGA